MTELLTRSPYLRRIAAVLIDVSRRLRDAAYRIDPSCKPGRKPRTQPEAPLLQLPLAVPETIAEEPKR